MQCLNLNNKEVKAAVDEVARVLGSEDAAYYIISENNGYAIDQAPNGAQSKLFSDLLSHYNGNREQAIKAKAKVFTDEFKSWFGDWTNVLKQGDIIFGHPAIGKTYSLETGKYRDKLIDWDVEFNTKRDKWIEEHSNTKKGTPEYKKARNEYLIYPEKHPDYVEFITSEWERVKNKTKKEGKILFASPHNLLKMFPQDFNRIINLEYSDFVSRNINRGGKEKESMLWKEGIDATISKIEGIPVETLKENQYFEDYLDKYLGISKVVDENGEPLIVYHYSDNPQLNEFSIEFDNYFSTIKGGTKKAIFFTGNSNPKQGTVLDRNYKYPVFLNARHTIEKTGTKDELRSSQEGFVSTINRAANEADAAIFHGIDDNQELNQDIYVINNPNNVKSVDNQGSFSTQDNNIHRNEASTSTTFFSSIGSITGTWSDGSPHMSTTSGQVVERLKQYIPKDSIAYQILDLFSDTDVYIGITEEKDQLANGDYMWYSDNTHTIWINKEIFEETDMEYNAKSIVHEMVHAFTSRSFENVKSGIGTDLEIKVYNKVKDLLNFNRKLYQEIRNEKGKWTGSLYGLKDEFEFIAEFLTNEEFVNNIVDDARQKGLFKEAISKLREIWSAIIDLLTRKEHVKNTENTRDLLMELFSFNLEDNNESANIRFEKSLNNQVKQLETNIHEAEKYNFDTKEELDKRLSDIRQNLLSGLQSRLRSIDITDISKRTEVIENIKYQIANLQNNAINDFDVIASFITDLKLDVRDVGNRVVEAYKGQADALTDEELVALNKNYFAFYCEQAKDIYNSLVNMNTYKQIVGESNYNKLMTELQLCKSILDQSYDAVKRMQVVNAQRIMLKEGMKVNSPTIYNYISENTRKTDFDISYITRVLGSGDRINDEAIKSLFNILQNTENSINEVVFQKANELNKLLKVAGNRNQKLLFEVDENGNTTGYIIRDLNYGRFYKDLKQFKEQLQREFGVDHQTLQLPENIATRTEYNKRLNKWLSEHCERKYTNEFYDLMNSLSPEAASAREMIMSKIRTLSNKYRDNNGVIHYESMTDEEWNTLQQYELDKKELASIYDIYGNEKPEGSVERRIADELTELNNKLSKNLNKNYNQQKFQELIEEKRNSLSKHEFKKWMDRNTRVVYTEEFYEQLANLDRADYGEVYAEYNKQKRAILNMFRDNRTGEVNPKLMPNSTKRLLDQLEVKMNNIRKSSKKRDQRLSLVRQLEQQLLKLIREMKLLHQQKTKKFLVVQRYSI